MKDSEKVKILVVDDRPEQRLALTAVLGELGTIVEAASGREALRCLLREEFAVILLDVNMPGMDGFETAALIRERKETEATPIIFVTAYSDELRTARGYSLGAVDYILAPVDPAVLKTKVGVFVELYRKALEVRRQADALRERANQLHRLTEASLAIHSAVSIDRVLQVATDIAAELIGAHQAIARLGAGLNGSSGKAAFTVSGKYAEWPGLEASAIALAVPVFPDGRPVRLTQSELETLPAWQARGRGPALPMRGWMAAPLNGRDGRMMGWIQLSDRYEGDFTEDDQAILVQIAQMAAVAVENTIYSEAREANRLKDEFLGTLSHELRTPLQAMLTWVRLLRSERADAAMVARGLEVIERSARSQAQLIEDILDVSRIITGKLRLETRPLELARTIAAAVEAIRPMAAAKGVDVRTTIDPMPCVVSGDPARLQQVLGNLLSNGVKFAPNGGWIEVALEAHGAQARVVVRDNGQGIEPRFLKSIFERFRQADSTTTRSHGGLGLGLAIARHLVELHGGTIEAESAGAGKGAMFTVTVPRTTATVPALEVDVAGGTAAPTHPEAVAELRLDGVRVLLVEDESDTRESLALALERCGARVTPVASARAALAAVEDAVPDVVLSDVGMPGQDGYSLIRELRSRTPDRGGRVAAVALTAYVRPEDRVRALLAGFDAHVDKPVGPAELAAVVKRLAERTTTRV